MSLEALDASFAQLNLREGAANSPPPTGIRPAVQPRIYSTAPVSGAVYTVRYLTPEQKANVMREVTVLREGQKDLAAAKQQIADAQERQRVGNARAEAAQQQEDAHLKAAAEAGRQREAAEGQLKTDKEKLDADLAKFKQLLLALNGKVGSMRALNQNDPTALAKIEAFAKTVATLQGNIPLEGSARTEQVRRIQSEAAVLMKAVKVK